MSPWIRKSHIPLEDNASIVVIGGGPAGSFFAMHILRMARELGRAIEVVIVEKKDFAKMEPHGCNKCAGVIAESLVEKLIEANLYPPAQIVQREITGYGLYTNQGSISIAQAARIRPIFTVFRGNGPRYSSQMGRVSFDGFLLEQAQKEGAKLIRRRALGLKEDSQGHYRVYLDDERELHAHLVVIACGVKTVFLKEIEAMNIGYVAPQVATMAQAEIELNQEYISKTLDRRIAIFLLNLPGVEFGALIPKRKHLTVTLMGERVDNSHILQVLNHPRVRQLLPEGWTMPEKFCHCRPKINIRAARKPYGHRLVVIGDAGATRLYKDGIGSAFVTARSAARAALLHGIGEGDFAAHYNPICRKIAVDNLVGKVLFQFNTAVNRSPTLTKTYLRIIGYEQTNQDSQRGLSEIFWDMFTGNKSYSNIFLRSCNPVLIARFLMCLFAILRRGRH